jgi:hypothetical protein
MRIEIPAAAVRHMTGRCVYHQCDLDLVPYADEGLDTPLDAWYCPGFKDDPDLKALNQRHRELGAADPGPWDRRREETREAVKRIWAGEAAIGKRCRDSWVIFADIPEG